MSGVGRHTLYASRTGSGISIQRSRLTSCLISSIGKSGARSAGPIGWPVPGWSGGGSERNAGIADIGQWFAEHARSGTIVEGHRLGRGTKTVRLGRVRKKDLPMVSDGPFAEAKESVGSYAIVDVKDEGEAIAIAKRWPAGGVVEVRPVAE